MSNYSATPHIPFAWMTYRKTQGRIQRLRPVWVLSRSISREAPQGFAYLVIESARVPAGRKEGYATLAATAFMRATVSGQNLRSSGTRTYRRSIRLEWDATASRERMFHVRVSRDLHGVPCVRR